MSLANRTDRPIVRQTVTFERIARKDDHLDRLLTAASVGGCGEDLSVMSVDEIRKRLFPR